MSVDLVGRWGKKGYIAKGIVIILAFMSIWSLTIMIQKFIQFQRAQAETRKVRGLMGSRVVGAELALGKAHERLAQPDEELVGQLRAVVDVLVDEAAVRAAAA